MSIARPDRAFFLIASAGALAFVTLPRESAIYERWYQLFLIAAVLATLVGVALHRPRSATPWYLVAVGGLLGVAADAVRVVDLERDGIIAFPATSDYLALGSYVVLAAGLLVMIRMQVPGRDWPSLVDAGIVTVGVGLVAWTFVMQPRISSDESALETVVALAFPVLDVLLVSLVARMVLGPGIRCVAFTLVTTALVFQLVGDTMYGFGSLHGWYERGDSIDLLFVLSAVLWGTAALHPSMAQLTERGTDPEQRLSRRRLAVLSAASLMPPAAFAIAALRVGHTELLVVVGAAVTLALLVIVRLGGLVARHERSERREQALARAAAALVAAWTREDVRRVAVESAAQIAASGRASVRLEFDDEREGSGDLEEESSASLFTVPIVVGDVEAGRLVVETEEPLSSRALEGIEALSAQVALALEGIALAESLHERQSAERFRSLVQNSTDVILLLSGDLRIRYHTPSVGPVLGYGDGELVGTWLPGLVVGVRAEELSSFFETVRGTAGVAIARDLSLRRSDGSVCQLETMVQNLADDPNVAGVVVTARDVTERRALEEQLAYQAFHDPLTGLANRALFTDRVTHVLQRSRRRAVMATVFLIDLDDFKTVNDSLGHAAGDELLVGVARRLQSSLRPEDTCARLGGDEFAVLLEDVTDLGAALEVGSRLARAIAEPLDVLGSEVVVQGSVGVALGDAWEAASDVLRNADLAMYQAKEAGNGRVVLYEPSMHERVLDRLALKADLRRALDEDEFEVHFQPIVSLRSGEVSGVEALVRWRHPDRGLVLPDGFIPLAEETGLILPLGQHVLRVACAHAQAWRDRLVPGLGIGVNISAKQLSSASLPEEVTAALAESGLPPEALVLEITESMLLDSDPVIARLEALRALGVRIAIDDFGTGYSSLNYLRRFPVDILKIARPFVDGIGSNVEERRLAAAIVRLGSTLGFDTVAEGVEDTSQLELLRGLGCRYGQGFLFARPLPAEELEPLLRTALVA